MASTIQIASAVGILLSLYALYVEHMKEADLSYVALCDLSSWVACSKVFTSEYGKMMSHFGLVARGSALDLPNAAYGVVFYLLAFSHQWVFAFLPSKVRKGLMLLAALASASASAYLGYILYAVLHDLCVVCVSTYVVNAFILVAAARAFFAGKEPSAPTAQDTKKHA